MANVGLTENKQEPSCCNAATFHFTALCYVRGTDLFQVLFDKIEVYGIEECVLDTEQ